MEMDLLFDLVPFSCYFPQEPESAELLGKLLKSIIKMFKLSDMSHKVEKSKKSTAEAENAEIPGSGPGQALGKCFSTFISSASVFISTALPRFFCRFFLPFLIAVSGCRFAGQSPSEVSCCRIKTD